MRNRSKTEVLAAAKAAIDAGDYNQLRACLLEQNISVETVTETKEVLKDSSQTFSSEADYNEADKEYVTEQVDTFHAEPILGTENAYQLIIYAREQDQKDIENKLIARYIPFAASDKPLRQLEHLYNIVSNSAAFINIFGRDRIEILMGQVLDNPDVDGGHYTKLQEIVKHIEVDGKLLDRLRDAAAKDRLHEKKARELRVLKREVSDVKTEINRLSGVLAAAKEAHEGKLGSKLVRFTSRFGLFTEQDAHSGQRSEAVERAQTNLDGLIVGLDASFDAAQQVDESKFSDAAAYAAELKKQCDFQPMLEKAATFLIRASDNIQRELGHASVKSSATKDAIDAELANIQSKSANVHSMYHQVDVPNLRQKVANESSPQRGPSGPGQSSSEDS